VALFLGEGGVPSTLEQAAHLAVAQVKGADPVKEMTRLAKRDAILQDEARALVAKRRQPKGRYLRGLFSGGTFCAEAQVALDGILRHLTSNAPLGETRQLKSAWKLEKNAVVDLGEDEFTVGRAHPMIDYTLRNQMILDEAANPETAVILIDVVLGHGANLDPAAELVPVIKGGEKGLRRRRRHRHDRRPAEPRQGGGSPPRGRRPRAAHQRRGLQTRRLPRRRSRPQESLIGKEIA
jgi:hypothetical protein